MSMYIMCDSTDVEVRGIRPKRKNSKHSYHLQVKDNLVTAIDLIDDEEGEEECFSFFIPIEKLFALVKKHGKPTWKS